MAIAKLTLIGLYNFNDHLFDALQVPDGLDKDALVFSILERAGDFPVLYPDYDFCAAMLAQWSKTVLPIYERLYSTTQLEYNPIENYNRVSKLGREVTSESHDAGYNAGKPFNTDDFVDNSRSTTSGDGHSHEDVTEHVSGNIGVTTSQQMINQEREVVQYNIYDKITADFIARFCIEIY